MTPVNYGSDSKEATGTLQIKMKPQLRNKRTEPQIVRYDRNFINKLPQLQHQGISYNRMISLMAVFNYS